jgi:hypothetical protein
MGCTGSICSYNGTGVLGANGSAAYFPSNNIYYRFPIGSIVYVIFSAINKGILQKVLISNVKIRSNNTSVFEPSILYFDQYNWQYNENELCDLDSAKELAILYYENQKIETNRLPPIQSLSKYPVFDIDAKYQYALEEYIIQKF